MVSYLVREEDGTSKLVTEEGGGFLLTEESVDAPPAPPPDDTAAMVGSRFDVVIDGHGYIFWAGLMQSLPFRNQRAAFAYSPTFIERSNISGAYGDNQQDFFLTVAQADWSEGEGQRYLHTTDADSPRKYFSGQAVDTTSVQGQVTMRSAVISADPVGSQVFAMCPMPPTLGFITHAYVSIDGGGHTPTLHTMTAGGTDTSLGAHGAGTVNPWGICNDGVFLYIAGATTIRRWDGASFTDFGTNANAGSICFLNNALYSCDGSVLKTYDGSGSATVLFPWKDASGNALQPNTTLAPKLVPFGGDLLIYWPYMNDGPELWQYDGTETNRLAKLPASMAGYDAKVINGVVYLSGMMAGDGEGTSGLLPVVYYYLNGTIDELWRETTPVSGVFSLGSTLQPALGDLNGKLIIIDPGSRRVLEWDPSLGALSNISNLPSSGSSTSNDLPMVSSTGTSVLFTYDAGSSSTGNTLGIYPDQSSLADQSTVRSSLIDFDNSLVKVFRSITIEKTGGATSVSPAYSIDPDNLSTAAYTAFTITDGAGTYFFPASATGRAVSIELTLEDTGGAPTLKRMYVRAVPVVPTFRRVQYVLDLGGRFDRGQWDTDPVRLRDGTDSPLSGSELAANLIAAITSTVPITVTDEFGTYPAVFEQGPGVTEIDEVRPGEYVAQVTLRSV